MSRRMNFDLRESDKSDDAHSRSWLVAEIVFGLSALAMFIWFLVALTKIY